MYAEQLTFNVFKITVGYTVVVVFCCCMYIYPTRKDTCNKRIQNCGFDS